MFKSKSSLDVLAEAKDIHSDEPVKFDSTMEPWLYLMKPFHKDGQELSVGLLRVRIIRSKDLPKMDTFNNDPFCRFYLTQEGGKEHMQETQVMHGKRNAVWNETFEFEVTHTLCSLHMQVRDWDKASGSDRIGVIEIPLAELQPGKKVKAWYPIALREDLRVRQMKKNVKNSDNPDKERKCAAIEIELEFDFSKIGDFASHFTVMQPPAAAEEAFDMDKLYANAIEFQNNIWPFIEILMCINPILLWTDPFNSGLVLLVFVECCLNTWMVPVIGQLLLIRYLCWQYVLRRWKIEEDRRPKVLNKSRVPNLKKESDDAIELERIKEEKKKERDAHLNGFLTSVAESSISAAKMTDTLQITQNTLGFVNEWISLILEWLSWKYPSISAAILSVLLVTTVYSCFFPFAYVALVVGVAVLCIFTVPMAVVIWLISGTAFYASQRSYLVAEAIEFLKEKYLKKDETVVEKAANEKDLTKVLDEQKLDVVNDDEKADGKPPRPPSSSALQPIAENTDHERSAESELKRTESEYTMVSDDEDDSSSSGDSGSDSESDGEENGERRKKGKRGKEKRKRGFLKKLFNIDKDKDKEDEGESDHDKDKEGGKEHGKVAKEKSKSLIRRFSSSSKSTKEKLGTS